MADGVATCQNTELIHQKYRLGSNRCPYYKRSYRSTCPLCGGRGNYVVLGLLDAHCLGKTGPSRRRAKQTPGQEDAGNNEVKLMMKHARDWVRTWNPVITLDWEGSHPLDYLAMHID